MNFLKMYRENSSFRKQKSRNIFSVMLLQSRHINLVFGNCFMYLTLLKILKSDHSNVLFYC